MTLHFIKKGILIQLHRKFQIFKKARVIDHRHIEFYKLVLPF